MRQHTSTSARRLRRPRRPWLTAAAIAAAAGVLVLATLPRGAAHLAPGPAEPWPVVTGAYHVHSTASDGTGSLDEIAAAAARAGLQFVIVTDHGDATRRVDPPRYRHGVLCLEAVEISADEGHYAALGLPAAPYALGGDARAVAEDVARLGGFGIVTHPDSAKADLAWHDWTVPFPAIEWLNADSQWRDETRWMLPLSLGHYLIRAPGTVASLFDRPEAALRRWDQLCRTRRIVALAGHDAHQRLGLRDRGDPYRNTWHLRMPAYEALFRAFALRVELDAPWSGDAAADAGALVAAIRSGRVFTAIDAIAGPAHFVFTATAGESTARMGGAIPAGPARLDARSNAPPDAATVLLRNGAVVREQRGGAIALDARLPGVYRVEVRLPGAPGHPPIPWIVSNPIWIGMTIHDADRPAGGATGTATPASPESLEGWPGLMWTVEKDPTSDADLRTAAGPAATDRVGIDLRFRLGPSRTASPYAAAVARGIGAIADAHRVVFRATADRPMRAALQLRLAGAHPDARWIRSFYADSTARVVSIAISDLRPVLRAAGSSLDLSRVDTILFVVDSRNTAPGSAGRLAIEGLRAER